MEDVMRAGSAVALGLGMLAALAPEAGQASPLTATLSTGSASGAVETNSVTLSSCFGGAYRSCTDAGSLSTTFASAGSAFIGSPIVGGGLATFTTAFDAWNAANGGAWTLVNGGVLENVSITATIDLSPTTLPSDSQYVAGLAPVIFEISGSGLNATLLSELVWTQALVVNYAPLVGLLSAPIETLDTFSLSQDPQGDNPNFAKSCSVWSNGAGAKDSTFCDPIYPFQYGTSVADTTPRSEARTTGRSATTCSTTRPKASGPTRASRRSPFSPRSTPRQIR